MNDGEETNGLRNGIGTVVEFSRAKYETLYLTMQAQISKDSRRVVFSNGPIPRDVLPPSEGDGRVASTSRSIACWMLYCCRFVVMGLHLRVE